MRTDICMQSVHEYLVRSAYKIPYFLFVDSLDSTLRASISRRLLSIVLKLEEKKN